MPDQEQNPEPDVIPTQPDAHPTGAPPVGAVLDSPTVEPATPGESDSTVGTGTSIALGCVVGTIVLIVFGLIFLGIVALFN
jgi:hypothetical protein